MKAATSSRTVVLVLIGVLISAVGLTLGATEVANSKPSIAAPVITSGPATMAASTSATFTITTSNGTSLQCSLDNAAYTACTSPKSYSGLGQGKHTFGVKAVQGSDQSAVTSYSWTVDTVAPPPPTITSSPSNPSATTNATFAFADSDSGVTFRCSLDNAAYTACSVPKSYSTLAQGTHTFGVQAVDAAGNVSPTTAYTWVLDTVPPAAPTYTSKPSDPTYNASNTFAWSASESGLTFQCSKENGAWFSCTSPYTWVIDTSNYGQHQFGVRAMDAAGNVSAGSYYSFKYEKGLPATGMPFTISGSVGALSIGNWKPIPVTISNPNSVTIFVTGLTVAVAADSTPAGCASATNIELQQSNITSTATVSVPAGQSITLPAQAAVAPQIRLKDLPTVNQDVSKSKTFALSYSGTATN